MQRFTLNRFWPLVLLLVLAAFPAGANAQEDKAAADLPRDEEGVKVARNVHVAIPEGMEIKQVARNVTTPEPAEFYLTRQFEKFEAKLEEFRQTMRERLQKIEDELKVIKVLLDESQKSKIVF